MLNGSRQGLHEVRRKVIREFVVHAQDLVRLPLFDGGQEALLVRRRTVRTRSVFQGRK